MRTKAWLLIVLQIFLLVGITLDLIVCATEERKILSRSYVGLGVEVYSPYQCYPSETITVRVRVEALEDVKNTTVTLFIWGSKSEGQNPWGTSFTVLEVPDFPSGTIREEAYKITMPSDIDPGLTYGILLLDWSIYRTSTWENQWDKASFRATYVKNKGYEDLQTRYNSATNNLQNTRTLMYIFLTTTVISMVSIMYFARKR